MTAHDPQDQHLDAPAGPASAEPGPASEPCGDPSVRALLASCAAARTVSTPPAPPRPGGATPAAPAAAEPPATRPADAA